MSYRRVPLRRSDDTAGVFLLACLVFAALLAVRGWAVMILVGVLHAEAGFPPHTLGFWTSVLVAILYSLATAQVETKAS